MLAQKSAIKERDIQIDPNRPKSIQIDPNRSKSTQIDPNREHPVFQSDKIGHFRPRIQLSTNFPWKLLTRRIDGRTISWNLCACARGRPKMLILVWRPIFKSHFSPGSCWQGDFVFNFALPYERKAPLGTLPKWCTLIIATTLLISFQRHFFF